MTLMAVVLVGCSGPVDDDQVTPEPTPTETVIPLPPVTQEPIDEAVDPDVETAIDTDSGPTAPAGEESIAPDPGIMATMECEPLSEDLRARMRIHFGTPERSVQVEVGEGLTPGEIWWVIVLDSPSDDSYQWVIPRRFLTNAPGVAEDDIWIPLWLSDTWRPVKWDSERLVRGQSALTKALECLDL